MPKYFILLSFIAFTLLSGCSASTFGKFRADQGKPPFLTVGKTSREEVLNRLGEPLVHREVAGLETMIYNHESGNFFVLYGEYEGQELVIRFKDQIVADVDIEQTGDGWGILAPASTNNPGSRRSAR